jgi:RNA polymerase sigma-70 factor (ECF subfamily)
MDPAFAAERKDLVDAARRELERLPDDRRAAVEMKIVDGLTFREVADALGVPLGTVAFWVRQSLDAIAEKLRHLR